MPTAERRIITPTLADIRMETNGDKRTIVGYGARFYDGSSDTQCVLQSDRSGSPRVVERIMPQAFDNDILPSSGGDVIATFNHNPDMLLGRRSAGTLRLACDHSGLRYEIDPPDTQAGRDVVSLLERGDVRGSSFGFHVRREKWSKDGDCSVRTIEDVRLEDVGPVSQPAYAGATAGLRTVGEDGAKEAIRSMEAWQQQSQAASKFMKARLREIEARAQLLSGESRGVTASVRAMIALCCRTCADICKATAAEMTIESCAECAEACRACARMCWSCEMSECIQCAAACSYCVDQCHRGPSADLKDAFLKCAEACKRCAAACDAVEARAM